MVNKSAHAATTGDVQYQRLLAEIVSGALPAGSVLLETALAARYDAGRNAIREAIIRLECDELVVRGPRGAQVRVLSAPEVVDIYQARIALESEAAAAAARHLPALDAARLRQVQELCAATGDSVEANRLHSRWHAILWSSCGNPAIAAALERLTLQLSLDHNDGPMAELDVAAINEEHAAIFDAITAGEQDEARRLLRAHLEGTRDLRIAALARSSATADRHSANASSWVT